MNKYLIHLLIISSVFSCSKNNNNESLVISDKPEFVQEISQTEIFLEGFFDIKWGDSVTSACNILRNKDVQITDISNKMVIAKGNFAGYKCYFALYFYRNQFYSGNVGFLDKKEESIYREFVSNLKKKYGEPDYVNDTDDYKTTEWRFVNGCKISAQFSNDFHLSYGNEKLIEELHANEVFNDL